jgi:hypothetical protein
MTKMVKRTIAGLFMLSGAGLAAQDTVPPVPPAVRESQALLIAAYPELREGRIAWRIEPTATGVVVEARRLLSPNEPSTPDAPIVGATVKVDEQGIESLDVRGSLIDDVRRKVGRINTRSRRGVADGLRAAKAAFDPAEPGAADELVPAGVPRMLGAPNVRETTFRTEKSDEKSNDAMTWQVDVESTDTVPRRYTLVFEPVEGRLLSVVRR